MTVSRAVPAKHQMTLAFEPSLPDAYPTLRAFMARQVQIQVKPMKSIAGDMDMAPSTLSRKLTPSDGDTQRFNVDDLELYMRATSDTSPIEYLASKYLHSDEHRKARAIARVEVLATDLEKALHLLRAAGA